MELSVYYMLSVTLVHFPLLHLLVKDKLLALVLGILKPSLDECTEFIILGLITIVVHGLLSFHHSEKFGNFLLQHFHQQ
jgi:hypothetical protein